MVGGGIISILEVDSVEGSTVLVLNLSVASGDSHVGVASVFLASLGLGDVLLQFLKELDGLVVALGDLVGDLLLLDTLHGGVAIEGGLSDWDDTFDDVPEDTLVTWSGGQRALVGPSLVELDLTDELFKVQHESRLICWVLDELTQKFVVPLDVGLWISFLHFFEIFLWHDLEEESENTGTKLRVIMFPFVVEEMDDVHFEIEELAVDGVLTGGVEMELGTVEGGDGDVLVEERDRLGLEAVEILALGLSLGDIEEEGVTDFVELHLFRFLVDLIVVEAELFVLEIFEHWHLGAEVDGRLLLAEVAWLGAVEGLLHLHVDFGVKHEVDSGSLADGVLVVLGEVVLETVHVVGLAAGSALGGGPSLRLVILTDDLPVLLVVLVGVLLEVDVLDAEGARLLDLLLGPLDLVRFERGLAFGWGEAFSVGLLGVPLEHVGVAAEGHLLRETELEALLLAGVDSGSWHTRAIALSLLGGSAWVDSMRAGVPVLLTFELSPDGSLSRGRVLALFERLDVGALLGGGGLSWGLERLPDWGDSSSDGRWLVRSGTSGERDLGRSGVGGFAVGGHDPLGGLVAAGVARPEVLRESLLLGRWQSLWLSESGGLLGAVLPLSDGRLGLLGGRLVIVHC